MDPKECLARILNNLINGEKEKTIYSLEDLAHWLRNGGFLPEINEYKIDWKQTPAEKNT